MIFTILFRGSAQKVENGNPIKKGRSFFDEEAGILRCLRRTVG